MAISLKTAGTWARKVSGVSNVITIPGTPAAGDRMYLFGSWKTYTITVTGLEPDWTLLLDHSDGTTDAGNGTGSVHNAVYYRDWQSGDSDPVLFYSSAPTEGHWVIMLWTKGAGETWDTPEGLEDIISGGDPWTSIGAVLAGDLPDASVVMSLVGLRDDSSTIGRTATSIDDSEGAGVVWNGNYVESPATHFSSTTGLDMSGDLGHRFVTTGAAGVILQSTGNPVAAETGTVSWVIQSVTAGAATRVPYSKPYPQLLAH